MHLVHPRDAPARRGKAAAGPAARLMRRRRRCFVSLRKEPAAKAEASINDDERCNQQTDDGLIIYTTVPKYSTVVTVTTRIIVIKFQGPATSYTLSHACMHDLKFGDKRPHKFIRIESCKMVQ